MIGARQRRGRRRDARRILQEPERLPPQSEPLQPERASNNFGRCSCGGRCPKCNQEEQFGTPGAQPAPASPAPAKAEPAPELESPAITPPVTTPATDTETEDRPGEPDLNAPLANPRFVGDAGLEKIAGGDGILGVGSFGPSVARVQQALVDLGFDLPRFGVDCDFGGETQKAMQDFQKQQEAKTSTGAVGKETIHLLDQAAPRKDFESLSCPERRPPAKKEPPTYDGPCRFVVEDHEFGDAPCPRCGGGKIIQWTRIRAEGRNCPSDLSGKKFNEQVRLISSTCPGGISQGVPCETTKDGTLRFEGGPCMDRYFVCPKLSDLCDLGFYCPMFPLPLCETEVEQTLLLDGVSIKVRTITVRVFLTLDVINPICFASVSYK
jgi:hypothetical protein